MKPRFCIFEQVYFSRPDSVIGGASVYETRRRIGVELAREAPVEADLVCPIPDSGTPAAIGYSQESGIPYAMGIIRNQYMGRTFIEPSEQIRNMGVRLKLNVNRAVITGKRVVLVDDSVVRGTTSRKIREMVLEAGAAEVHFRIASPPTQWPCFYGVDTPDRDKLLAAGMSEEEMRAVRRRRQPEVRLARRPLPRLRRPAGPRRPPAAVLRRLLLRRLPGAPVRPHRAGLPAQGRRLTATARASPSSPAPAAASATRSPAPSAPAATRSSRSPAPSAASRTLADEIEAAGGPTPTLVPLSMTDEGGLQRLCLAIHERWGRLDLALHCAAHAPPLAPAAHLADKDFDQSFEVNVKGTERLIVYLTPLLGPSGHFVYAGRQPRRPALLRRLRRLQGRRRGAGPLLRRRIREDRPARHPLHPNPMPTALRARFYPGEDAARLTPCADEATRLLALIDG